MIPRWLPLALSVVVFAPGFLHAQQRIELKPNVALYELRADYDKMYEDIEIFRRILDRKLHPLYPRTQYPSLGRMRGMPGMPGMGGMRMGVANPSGYINESVWVGLVNPYVSPNNRIILDLTGTGIWPNNTVWVQEEVRQTLEGVYLKGLGVVFTATLSSLQAAAKAETTKKPVSEWESVRRQLHNEKEEPKKAEASKPLSLSDVLLKVLAENGHHFSQLGENESLTIVITLHETNPASTATRSGTGSAKTVSKPAAGGREALSVSSKVRDLELLGDLHMKQEHYGMARDAFREAVELKPEREQMAKLARKLAQAYLMLNEIEKARGALDQAIALMKKETETKEKPAAAAKPAPALPGKLIISAPKKLLDQVKEGKITFEEFRRQAHVETLRFDDRHR